ncbi:metallophosphoesterase [soil metagenome]
MIDLIGDIHGHADKLKTLLTMLGYTLKNGSYYHPERKVLFVGDYIDRGPQIRETLQIVRSMVESDSAIALMGNHEYNAICYHYQDADGRYLRAHSGKNNHQHSETLKEFKDGLEEYEDYLKWFITLPLFYETDKLRAVHACWDKNQIEFLRNTLVNDRLTDELIVQSVKKDTLLYQAIEDTLKGKEINMPDGAFSFKDKDGSERCEIRIRWWEDPAISTYKNYSVHRDENLPDIPLDMTLIPNADYYIPDSKPVFFGHYWLNGNPFIYKKNVCCLDYSVAQNGYLAAYRFDDETELNESKLVYV